MVLSRSLESIVENMTRLNALKHGVNENVANLVQLWLDKVRTRVEQKRSYPQHGHDCKPLSPTCAELKSEICIEHR
jgi:hypothetical protein